MCYNAITGSAPLIFLNYCTFTVLPTIFALRHTQACSNSNASAAKPMAFTLLPTPGTIFPKMPGYSLFPQKQTRDIAFLWIFQLGENILHPCQFIQCVCVCACMHACVCVCVCVCCTVMLEALLRCTFCVSFCKISNNFLHLDVHYMC